MKERFEKETKKYILKNKDISILTFNYEKIIDNTKFGEFATYHIKNIKVLEDRLLPVDFLENFSNLQLNSPNLKKWINGRKVPSNRENVEEILLYKGINDNNNFMRYIEVSFGLSLNDSYWILPEDKKDYLWKDYNLYENKFDEMLTLIAFGENKIHTSYSNEIKISPEYTTDGMLAKCWIIIDDKIYLFKKSSKEHQKEAYTEYYMAQIAEKMKFKHIDYDLIKFKDDLVSSCELFTSEDIGFVPIHKFLTREEVVKEEWKLLEIISEKYGEKDLEDLMLFDSIVFNKDRHLGNLGLLIDNNTNEVISSAPIFDNGNSILNFTDNTTDKLSFYGQSKMNISFDELGKVFVKERHRKNLEDLKTFSFKRHNKYNLSENTLIKVENFIKERATQLLSQLDKKKELSSNKKKVKIKKKSKDKEGNER
ncbi:MAG: protein kinase [Fusobacterium sp.]|nr:protein kinase [Fusobacterium sp.]